jgi:hypothetical protein
LSYGQRKCDNGELLLIFKPKRQCIVHLVFSFFFPLTIKDKTNISLTFKILHLRLGSFTRKVRNISTLKIIVSIFMKLFLILVLHLRQYFFVRIFVERATGKQRKKDQQTASPCSHLPSLFRENFRHRPSSLERNWKKWNAGKVVPWTTRCSVPAT